MCKFRYGDEIEWNLNNDPTKHGKGIFIKLNPLLDGGVTVKLLMDFDGVEKDNYYAIVMDEITTK